VDSLRVLATDPVDYLVTPRVLASMVAGPILNVLCFCMGEEWGAVGFQGNEVFEKQRRTLAAAQPSRPGIIRATALRV
jgi:ABC-type transporter Mla maintaining outer membrane lipid asymmetry permease subunit MlaE